MRIIGYIEHPSMKITVFKMENKLSVKFESGLYEQTYKFRDGEAVESLPDIQKLVDTTFLKEVEQELDRMQQIKNQAIKRNASSKSSEEFEDII